MRKDESRHLLAIYVLDHCVGCDQARYLAESIRGRALPNLEVQLVDLAAAGAIRPQAVFAVPTYLLDGQVLSLGNPEETWLLSHLAKPVGCL